ncbi:MAG: sigma-54-dependent Fis family transcriptional regulator [Alphaproteobacteria bacterium]|nr:sigma-54-dependent Fis family transcriptional regulator [Alphaproteobacteria bacterium]
MKPLILIVEDEATQRLALNNLCGHLGFEAVEARNGQEALALLKDDANQQVSLVLTDLNMPIMDGKALITATKELRPSLPMIVVTASSDIGDAVECVRMGAYDFITKPISAERLHISIQHALRTTALSAEVSRLTRETSGAFRFEDLIGCAGGLKSSIATGRKIATSDLPVLITGESGVGKEAFARAIHGESKRAGKPFIAINCGAIPANLAESVLFGHEKGAFTGAVAKAIGKFREAQGGTLFLDEIGELPHDTQVKLLRALQSKEIEPVGAGKPVAVDVRIISATHRDLTAYIKEGRFREDLFYRLNVLPLHLPALRERKDDILPLAHYFAERLMAREGIPHRTLDADAEKLLTDHEWPGNVRELENCISRTLLLCSGTAISRDELEGFLTPTNDGSVTLAEHMISLLRVDGSRKTMQEIEDEVIAHTLTYYGDSVPKAAATLEVGQSTLYRKLSDKKTA